MHYGRIVKAYFLERPNRFVAKVNLDGEETTVHVKNTGRCKELLLPGSTVYLEDHFGKDRKLRYSLIAVEKGALLVNMDSNAPNKVVGEALNAGTIVLGGLGKLKAVKPEKTYGDSRFDFYVVDEDGKEGYVEVKGVTLENDGIVSFPDAPTERGVKHVKELVKAKENGYYAGIIFVVQMEGMKAFTPNDNRHKAFGDALRGAKEQGVEILAYECKVTPDSLTATKPVSIKL